MTWYDASFGSNETGLATVGVTEYNATGAIQVARATAGVVETDGGGYGRDFTPDPATVTLVWDTGGGSPIYAIEDIVNRDILQKGLYEDGVWIDTTGGGAAGTVVGINGTQNNPVAGVADALTLATALGTRKYRIRGSITLAAAHTNWEFFGVNADTSVNIGGQDVDGSVFQNIGLTGNVVGEINGFDVELVGPLSGVTGTFIRCGLSGTITGGSGALVISQGLSNTPGTSTPVIDLNGVCDLSLRAYSGGMQLQGSSAGGLNSTLEFIAGQCILDVSNTAGTIVVRGVVDPVTDNSAGATVVTTAVVRGSTVEDTNTVVNGLNDLSQADVQAALTAQGYTAARAPNLDNLDAAVSTRATPASILAATLTSGESVDLALSRLDNIDVSVTTTIPGLIGGLNDIDIADVQTALTNQGYTAARAPNLDNLDQAISVIPTALENADALLNRDMSAVSDTNARTPLNALRFLRNRWFVTGTTLTVTEENDSTVAWTATLTGDATADPIIASDPA